jgi:hypothetical protein
MIHSSRIKHNGVEYIETTGEDEQGTGVLTWERPGMDAVQLRAMYAAENKGSLEAARERIKAYLDQK